MIKGWLVEGLSLKNNAISIFLLEVKVVRVINFRNVHYFPRNFRLIICNTPGQNVAVKVLKTQLIVKLVG